MKMTATDNGNH